MKKEIHPEWHPDAKVVCACGNKMTVGSTRSELSVELCSACHPFYTGKQKIMDSARRVEKFAERGAKTVVAAKSTSGKKAKTVKRVLRREEKKARTPDEKKMAEELKKRLTK